MRNARPVIGHPKRLSAILGGSESAKLESSALMSLGLGAGSSVIGLTSKGANLCYAAIYDGLGEDLIPNKAAFSRWGVDARADARVTLASGLLGTLRDVVMAAISSVRRTLEGDSIKELFQRAVDRLRAQLTQSYDVDAMLSPPREDMLIDARTWIQQEIASAGDTLFRVTRETAPLLEDFDRSGFAVGEPGKGFFGNGGIGLMAWSAAESGLAYEVRGLYLADRLLVVGVRRENGEAPLWWQNAVVLAREGVMPEAQPYKVAEQRQTPGANKPEPPVGLEL